MAIISAIALLFFIIELPCGRTQTGYIYLGCYADVVDFDNKALNGYGGYIPNELTLDYCYRSCIDERPFVYFGVESKFCFCDNLNADYSRYGALSESMCSDPCPGDHNQKCGSTNAIRVFRDTNTTCSTIPPVHNGVVDQNGVVANFKCNFGYRLRGVEFLTCGYNYNTEEFVWNGNPPICNRRHVNTDSPQQLTEARRVSSTPPELTTQRQTSTRSLTNTSQVLIYSSTKPHEVTVVKSTAAKRVTQPIIKAHPIWTTYKPTHADAGKSSTTRYERTQKGSKDTIKNSGTSKLFLSSMYSIAMSLVASLLLLDIFH